MWRTKFIVLTVVSMLVSGFFFLVPLTDNTNAIKVLKGLNYRHIKMTGYRFFACSHEDFYHSGFVALSSQGSPVSGVVCRGILFRGATVRFD